MDYEKAYKEALKRAKGFKTDEYKDVAEYIFPELAESEDERIRKALISFLKSPFVNESIADEKVTPWIAWLEKPCEHSPILSNSLNTGKNTWSEEDEERLKSIISLMKSNRAVDPFYDKMCLENWLKSLKERCTWKPSELQIEALVSAIDVMIDNRGAGDKNTILLSGLYHKLKAL